MAAVATLQPPAGKQVAAGGNNAADSGDSVESNTDTEEGATPLMYASQQGRDNLVQQMLAAEVGCALAKDRTGKTALHYCCEQAGPSTAALLLAAAPSLLDARDQDGYAPLTLAVIAGNRTLVRYLLARGADVNTADAEQHSVVHWATVCGDAASLELVVGAGATVSTPDLHGGYPIHYAAQLCGPQGAAATACTDTTNGGAAVSRSVTDRGAGLAVLRALLAAGASVSVRDHDGRQPLLWAASAGSADAILALVNAGADIEAEDKDGLTALHCAASRGHTDCVETLVSLCGAHVDVIDSNGCTALFYAVTLGHADATRLLLRRGAEPNRQDRKGRTAAHCGAAKGQLETLRILSAHGANLWLRNVRGDFPLHDAVQSGRSDLVRWLLSFKQSSSTQSSSAAADATNNDGRTPLHVAALHNNIEICKILLDARCLLNPTMRTNRHQLLTPLDAALLRGNRGCAKFLQLHGGVPASRLTESLGRLRATGRSPPPKQPENCPAEPSPPERSSTQMDLQSRTIQVHMKDDILQVGAPVVVCHHLSRSGPGSDGDCGQCDKHCCHRSVRRRAHTDVQRWRRRERQAKRREARLRDTSHNSSCSDQDDLQAPSGKDSTQKSTLSDGDSPIRVRKRTSFVQIGDGDHVRYSDGEAVHQNRRSRSERAIREGTSARKTRRHEKRSRSSRSNDNLDTRHRHHEDVKSTRRKEESKESSDREQGKQESVKSRRSESKVSNDTSRRRRAKSTEPNRTMKKSSKATEQNGNIEEHAKSKTSQRDVEIKSTTVLNVEKSSKSDEVKNVKEVESSTLTRSYSTDAAAADSSPIHNVSTRTVVTAVVHRENVSTSSASSEEETSEKVNGETEKSPSSSTQGSETAAAVAEHQQATPEGKVEETDITEEEHPKDEKARKRKEEKSESVKKEDKDKKEGRKRKEEKSESTKREDTDKEGRKKKEEKSETIKKDDTDKKAEERDEHKRKDDHMRKEVKEEHKRKDYAEEHKRKDDTEDHERKEEKDNEEKREADQGNGALETESKIASQERQEDGNERVQAEDSLEVKAVLDEQDGRDKKEFEQPSEEAGLSETVDSSPRETAQITQLMDQSTRTNLVSKERQESKYPTKYQHDEKEKRQSRAGEANRVNRYGVSNFRKEKTSNVRQVKKTVTSKSSYSVSSKKSVGKTGSRKESPAFTIDVDDEFSGRSPNDQLVDSGLEHSPRRETDKEGRSYNQSGSLEEEISDPENRRDYQEKSGKFDGSREAEAEEKTGNNEEISVTRAVQMSMRKYHLERRIFHELLELKRLQIRAGRANEQVLVKRLVDDYRRAGLIVGLQQYTGTYTFRSFEKYLYEQLRALQATGQHVVPRLQSSDDLERLTAALRRTRARYGSPPDDPLLCTLSTHRCHHALHAYSGIPCAAYIPRLNHHTIPKEDLENPGAHARAHATPRNRSNVSFLPLIDERQTEVGRFSRLVDSSRPVTLQLSHGQEKQVISLPTERLDKHKRYYVTFTIKGGPGASGETVNGQGGTGTSDRPPPGDGDQETAIPSRVPDPHNVPPKMTQHGKSF